MTRESSVKIICEGCGTETAVAQTVDVKKLVADVQENPPFCIVCSCRPVFGPRPRAQVWEEIALG